MDELNQIQNPNIPPVTQNTPNQGIPMGPSAGGSAKHHKYWLWIILAAALAVAGFVWWYIGNMAVEPTALEQRQVDSEAREDAILGRDIQEADLGDLDSEFKTIDGEINSL